MKIKEKDLITYRGIIETMVATVDGITYDVNVPDYGIVHVDFYGCTSHLKPKNALSIIGKECVVKIFPNTAEFKLLDV